MSSATAAPHEHQPVDMGLYYKIYGILMVLLILTVVAARINLGAWNLPIALLIAVIKAVLVIIYFMHMRYTGKLMWVYASAAFVWLAMMMFGIMSDVWMR